MIHTYVNPDARLGASEGAFRKESKISHPGDSMLDVIIAAVKNLVQRFVAWVDSFKQEKEEVVNPSVIKAQLLAARISKQKEHMQLFSDLEKVDSLEVCKRILEILGDSTAGTPVKKEMIRMISKISAYKDLSIDKIRECVEGNKRVVQELTKKISSAAVIEVYHAPSVVMTAEVEIEAAPVEPVVIAEPVFVEPDEVTI